MVKLILQVNPKAGCEESVFAKINAVFGNPFMSQIEQLSDFYMVLDFTPENVEKVTTIQDYKGVLDVLLSPIDIAVSSLDKATGDNDYYIALVKCECGRHQETMKNLTSSKKFIIRNAGFCFNGQADIILEVLSAEGGVELNHQIREIAGVEDTILYTLPHTYA